MKTFPIGGIHTSDNKLSAGKKIERILPPKQVIIPMSQCLGAASVPIVKKGDYVKVGQLIAKGEAFISSNIHSSVSGTVVKIDEVGDITSINRMCIVIDNDGLNTLDEGIISTDNIDSEIIASKTEIIDKVKTMGIVGMGGATFPTHIKMLIPEDKKVDYLIINGVECEPYLTSDHALMMEHSQEIIIGVKILMRGLSASKAVIGIENNKPDAIKLLKQASELDSNIDVEALKLKYPQGGEKQLIKAITKRSVPSGKLPLEVGCVVCNIGTVYAIYEAVQKNKPLIDRIVTVTGKCLKEPKNLQVPIGTQINELIDSCGGMPQNCRQLINGGPMMGKAITTSSIPVTKGTSGVLLFECTEALRNEPTNCIRCSKCTHVCPMGLEPYLLSLLSEKEMVERMERELIMNCIECGSCQYTCPAYRPLLDSIRLGKMRTGVAIRNGKR